jgi:hypothetical protein
MPNPFDVCKLSNDPDECKNILKEIIENVDNISPDELNSKMKELVEITGLTPKVLTEQLGVHCDCVE